MKVLLTLITLKTKQRFKALTLCSSDINPKSTTNSGNLNNISYLKQLKQTLISKATYYLVYVCKEILEYFPILPEVMWLGNPFKHGCSTTDCLQSVKTLTPIGAWLRQLWWTFQLNNWALFSWLSWIGACCPSANGKRCVFDGYQHVPPTCLLIRTQSQNWAVDNWQFCSCTVDLLRSCDFSWSLAQNPNK